MALAPRLERIVKAITSKLETATSVLTDGSRTTLEFVLSDKTNLIVKVMR